MDDVSELVAACSTWQRRKKSLVELSTRTLAQKQAEVFPAVVELAVRLFCTAEGADLVYYEVDPICAFFLREPASGYFVCTRPTPSTT